jgi:starch phosphorylase
MSDIAERSLHTRIARSVEAIRRSFVDNLYYVTAKSFGNATAHDYYIALAYTIRDRLLSRFIASDENRQRRDVKTVAYLSAEFLPGPHLGSNILNMGIWDNVSQAIQELGLDLEAILEAEEEPGLGNGGLGRLAACYMESLATLELPAIGYGIRYEYGIFEQSIQDGWQVEMADDWLRNGNPWELPRQQRYPVKFGGVIERFHDGEGRMRSRWVPESIIYGVAYDTPILGYGVLNVGLLRLWKSEAHGAFDLQAFNSGDFYGAVEELVAAQNITKVLYPNDEPEIGKALRLSQQYFFVSCSLQDMIQTALSSEGSLDHFPDRFVVQLNDTHPAIAIAEFMRLLLDEHNMEWGKAWGLTQRSFAYTNHTLLPEALETWPLELFRRTLPRHIDIIYEINSRFMNDMRTLFINDAGRLSRMSLIDEGNGDGVRRVRMANLACVGSMSINGVSEVHSELLKHTVLKDFHDIWPEKFQNKTNGVTPRRFIALANRPLAALIDEVIEDDWLRNLERLRLLEQYADDGHFLARWRGIKKLAKEQFSGYIHRTTGIALDPDSMFDVQVKRIHEYKRQHLNVLHIVSLYHQLKQTPSMDITPRSFIFGGKAAPGYHMAKLIIKLINSVADVINRDPQVSKLLKVVFVPDFNVKTGQRIYPAADLSEQISTAGKEASGTGNMKFMMNGALTIGTLDGANIEIREAVGKENFFLFGKTMRQVNDIWAAGYRPLDIYHHNERLRNVIDLINSGHFSQGDAGLFRPLTDNLLNSDVFLACADFQDYIDCQAKAGIAYRDSEQWSRMSVLNVARCGKFSSDRAVTEYNRDIWGITPLS